MSSPATQTKSCIYLPCAEARLERRLRSVTSRHPRAELFERYLNSPLDRDEAATREGMQVGELVTLLNEMGPLSDPIHYTFRHGSYTLRSMRGICDDYYGDRLGKFGAPFTLRFYLTEAAGLPPEMFELADFNFLHAGLPYFAGHIYGSRYGKRLFISCIQSDVAQRYTYLFLGRNAGRTEVREGLATVFRPTEDLRDRFARYVPRFRKVFQRYWIEALLMGLFVYAVRKGRIEELALQQFALTEREDRAAHIMTRIYRGLPQKLSGYPLNVVTERQEYSYHCFSLNQLKCYLDQK